MKRKTLNRILAVLVIATMFLGACTKDLSEVRLSPKISTSQLLNVRSDSATIIGFVVAAGSGLSEEGVVYNTATAPTVANNKIKFAGTVTGATFKVKVGGLAYATVYYARAYAISGGNVLYGEEVTFTTLPVVPTLTTAPVSAITGNSATSGGTISNAGGAVVTAKGIVYGLNSSPVITGTKTSDGDGLGAFTSALTALKGNKTYYVRSYATNSAGTGYGPQVTFTTLVDMPVVTTSAATGVTKFGAFSGGTVTYDGGGTISARGLAWGASPNPTISDSKIDGGTGSGIFVTALAGLTSNTTYHVRAYATNSAGTAYGADVVIKTLADILTWNIPGDYVEASYPGSGLANWSPDKSPQVISTLSAGDKLEGYVYLANASNQWKFATQPNWNGPNYGDGGAGKLDGNGGNFNSPAGYYKINANSTTMTYTAVATTWGLIGDATPGGWGTQTNMTYNPATRTFFLPIHLVSTGSFKFRGTSDWSVNYGSDAADGKLGAGAANIPVAVESDYAVTLDLSHPNAYTYTANRWGLIGDATPGGWSTDTNMGWSTGIQAFTLTLNLTAGSFKFRANDGWDINYGGTDLNALKPGGDNIPIASAGNYTITFDPVALKATVTKN